MHNSLLDNPFFVGLASAALQPALRSLLIFDAPPDGLRQIGERLRLFLMETETFPVELATLGASEQDDDLWGSLPLPVRGVQGTGLQLHPQLFSPERNADRIQLIVLPDLARLSLAVARSCIMLIGADVAHLQRNEQSALWRPQQVWLASCQSSEVGMISPHLLDRFALRLTWSDPAQQLARSHNERVADLFKMFSHVPEPAGPSHEELAIVREAAQRRVELTPEALERILDVLDDLSEYYYPRRELALARASIAFCQLIGETTLRGEHVERAAALLGILKEGTGATEPLAYPEKRQDQAAVLLEAGESGVSNMGGRAPGDPLPIEVIQSVATQTQELTLIESVALPVTTAEHPYPEDSEPPAREAASLRIPFHRFTLGRSDRGPGYGVEPSESLEDLAVVSTLLTAARFQKLRRQRSSTRFEDRSLLIEMDDLRRYRREQTPEEMLLVVLDYTSIQQCRWEDALLPFLSEAYVQRASIAIIQVGAQGMKSPLQAELVEARSLLVPRIGLALEAQAGQATPLGHGLDLAQQLLHRVLQHGRSAVQRVTLVVVSDGRGNVPLEASRKNSLTEIVTREGVDDALSVAQILRGMNRVEKVVLNPQPRYYMDLPRKLAEALGAALIDIPRDALEVEAQR